MVNKLELERTVNRTFSQQKYKSPQHKKQEKVKKDLKHMKCFKCSDMGHYAPIWVTMPSCAPPKLRARKDSQEGKEDN
jgi:hypothetical protein